MRQESKWDAKKLPQIVSAGANILANWPRNFFNLLESIADGDVTARTGYARGGLRLIYCSLLKSRALNKDRFVRKALLDFGERRWGTRGFSKTITFQPEQEPREPARFIFTSEFARRLGIHRKTVKRLIRDGLIPARTMRVGKTTRTVVDSQRIDIAPVTPGTIFGQRTAAAMIGIPVRLLERLKKDGVYKSNHLPTTLRGFHEIDVRDFTSSLKKLAVLTSVKSTNPPRVMTVANALHRIQFCLELQTRLICAILSRRLSIYAGSRKPAMELWIDKLEFDSFIDAEINQLFGATETYQTAATLLRCASPSIDGLIRRGFLTTVTIGNSKKILRESIVAFEKKYMPLSVIGNGRSNGQAAGQ